MENSGKHVINNGDDCGHHDWELITFHSNFPYINLVLHYSCQVNKLDTHSSFKEKAQQSRLSIIKEHVLISTVLLA
jgi:hypothetical protein